MKKLIIATAIMALTACGGSDDKGNVGSTNISGKAIDGYVEGATVYLDLNYNGVGDRGEPTVVTGTDGHFDLSVGEYGHCADYAPLVVDVPVGAYDTDLGYVEEAYQMQAPPKFIIPKVDGMDNSAVNVTPLTTVLWTLMKVEMESNWVAGKSCDIILSNPYTREDMVETAGRAMLDIARAYSVSTEDIFVDFIAGNNNVVHQKAMKIVDVLKTTYALKTELELNNPDAVHINAYLTQQKRGLYRGQWVEHQELIFSDRIVTSETLLNDDLTFNREYKAGVHMFTDMAGLTYEGFSEVMHGRDGTITCDRHDSLVVNSDGTTYIVEHKSETVYVDSTDECWGVNNNLETLAYRKIAVTSRYEGTSTWEYNTDTGSMSDLVDDGLLNIESELGTIDIGSVTSQLNGYVAGWDNYSQQGSDVYFNQIGTGDNWTKWIVYADGYAKYEKMISNPDNSITLYCGTDEYTASLNPTTNHFCSSW